MKRTYSLSQLPWKLAGFVPHQWRMQDTLDIATAPTAEISAISAKVPGSVQAALLDAGIVADWNLGLNARACEWVEHRHWIFQTNLPEKWLETGKKIKLDALGLDYCGVIRVNGKDVGSFQGSFIPHSFDLTDYLHPETNILQIVFEGHPQWLGKFGHTSHMTEWKPRFYYTWDWTSRLVQTGIWDDITLTVSDGEEWDEVLVRTSADPIACTGIVYIQGKASGSQGTRVHLSLLLEGQLICQRNVDLSELAKGVAWSDLQVELWWPNNMGGQPVYSLVYDLLDETGAVLDSAVRKIGFKHLVWKPCLGAPAGADPWLCVVNGEPLFLQGVNWTPVRPNFADVTQEQVDQRLTLYRDLGMNIMRVWGGAVLEREGFYDTCDKLGILVWQELPLSSSGGGDCWPPEDEKAIADICHIARSYITRRQHHSSLALWCGGNELMGDLEGRKEGMGKPVDATHPLISRLAELFPTLDPEVRFIVTSASGPRFTAARHDFGRGLHWDVHGPWRMRGDLKQDWQRYWEDDDALFRSEAGSPSASPASLIREYAGNLQPEPVSNANPLWRRSAGWTEDGFFQDEFNRLPESLEEYVIWSQERQRLALVTAAKCAKARFPAIGGFIIWMGHDCFPCTANTSIVDFLGNPKPAALALREVFLAVNR